MAQTKCAHPVCSCQVTEGSPHGKYCSEQCRMSADEVAQVYCECHHAGCRGAHP
jgi:hypothetical protein